MTKKISAGKKYILQAKRRLINDEYSSFIKNNDENFFLNNRQIPKENVQKMESIVANILASDDFVYDPLKKLIVDEEEFSYLDETLKEKYLFELSELYVYLRNKIS